MDEDRHRLWDIRFTAATFVVQLTALGIAGYWALWRYGTIETPTHQPRGHVQAKLGLSVKPVRPNVCEVLGHYDFKNVGTGLLKITDLRWAIFRMKRIDLPEDQQAVSVFGSDRLAGVKPMLTGVVANSQAQIASQLHSSWSLGWRVKDDIAARDRLQLAFWVWPNLTSPAEFEKACGTDAVSARDCPYTFFASGYPCASN